MPTLTTEDYAAQLAALFAAHGVDLSDSSGFASAYADLLTSWLGGDQALPAATGRAMASQISTYNAKVLNDYAWYTTAPNGGPRGDGTIDFVLPDGTTTPLDGRQKLVQSLAKGDAAGVPFLFAAATTDADPGAGKLRLNNAAPGSATQLFISETDAEGVAAGGWLDTFNSVAVPMRGLLYLQEAATQKALVFRITGDAVDAGAYRKVSAVFVAGSGGFADGGRVVASFAPAGDVTDAALAAQAGAEAAKTQAQAYAGAANVAPVVRARAVEKTYPNLFTEAATEIATVGNSGGAATVAASTALGLKCWVLSSAAGTQQGLFWSFAASAFPSGICSASVRVLDISASTGARVTRFMIQQYNGATEITAARATINMTAAETLTVDTTFEHVSIAIDPSATQIRYTIDALSPDAGPRTIKFRDMLIADGPVASYRRPYVIPNPASNATAIAGTDASQYLTAAASKAARDVAQVPVENVHALISALPNQFTRGEIDTTSALRKRSGTVTPVAAVYNGRPCWKITATSGSNSDFGCYLGPFSLAAMATPGFVSGALELLGVDAAGAGASGAAQAKVYLTQFTAADAEITAARSAATPVGAEALTTPSFVRHAGIAVDPSCDRFYLYIAINAGGAAADRSIYFGSMLIAPGKSAIFRPPNDALNSSSAASDAEAVAGASTAKFMTPAANEAARAANSETAIGLTDLQPNLFTAAELDFTDSSRLIIAGRAVGDVYAGVPCWRMTTPNGQAETAAQADFRVPRSDIVGNVFSCSIRILYATPVVSGTNVARVLIRQINGSGAEITAARQTITIEATPGAGVTTAKTFRLSNVAIDPACAQISMYIGANAATAGVDRSIYFRDMLICGGVHPFFRRPPSIGVTAAVISPDGSDVTGGGTSTSPYSGINRALTAIGGRGLVIVKRGAGGKFTTPQTIDPTKVKGRVIIIGERAAAPAYDAYPVFYCASKITGWSLVAGYANVWKATVAGLPTNANFNWGYFDGSADPRTAINAADRSPQHRGRTNRLMFATKVVKTTASTVSAACDEIQGAGATDPRAFIDDATGTIYRYGSAGDADNFFLDAAAGFIAAGTRESCGELLIQGIEVRYGGMDLRPFRRVHLDDVVVNGASANCIDYSVLTFGTLECAAAGGYAGVVGDGLNGHGGAKILHGEDYYGHDCQDDGWSDHEGCSARLAGGLTEYNGGTGLAPAYGSDHVSRNFIHRRNQQAAGRKPGQVAVVGSPSGAGTPDDGYDTLAWVFNHVTIGGTIGFTDGNAATSRLVCVNCRAYDYSTYGFDTFEVRDCGASSASGSSRSARTSVKNTALVT